MSAESSLLVPRMTYETCAVNIGTHQKSADMARFIESVRSDGLYLIDIAQTDQRIRDIAAFLGRFSIENVMVVSARQYGQRPARIFAEAVGARSSVGRFIPGTLTNPALRGYLEPDVLFVTDPASNRQAIREAISEWCSCGLDLRCEQQSAQRRPRPPCEQQGTTEPRPHLLAPRSRDAQGTGRRRPTRHGRSPRTSRIGSPPSTPHSDVASERNPSTEVARSCAVDMR